MPHLYACTCVCARAVVNGACTTARVSSAAAAATLAAAAGVPGAAGAAAARAGAAAAASLRQERTVRLQALRGELVEAELNVERLRRMVSQAEEDVAASIS